jgi:hypothetical protein
MEYMSGKSRLARVIDVLYTVLFDQEFLCEIDAEDADEARAIAESRISVHDSVE